MSNKILTGIVPIHGNSRHCLEDILAALASWWSCDHFMMFAFSWGFFFNRIPGEKYGKMIASGWTDDRLHYFENYHGIILKKQIPLDPVAIMTITESQILDNKPVAIYIDGFNLPWAKVYRKHHSVHCCLAIGITAQNIICLDPYASEKNEMLGMDDFYTGCKGCMTFELTQKRNGKILAEDLKQILEEQKKNNCTAQIKNFSEVIKNDFDIINEIDGYQIDDIKFAPIFYNIRHIINGRYNFAQLLAHFESQFRFGEKENIENELKSAAKNWETISSLLAKACYMPRIKNTVHAKVADKLLEIADHEDNIMNSLEEILYHEKSKLMLL